MMVTAIVASLNPSLIARQNTGTDSEEVRSITMLLVCLLLSASVSCTACHRLQGQCLHLRVAQPICGPGYFMQSAVSCGV